MITLAVANQKGGVGKTTTAVNLGHYLSLTGWRVLFIDMDIQGHVGKFLGIPDGDALKQVLMNRAEILSAKTPARKNLDVITNNTDGQAIEAFVMNQADRASLLRVKLEKVRHLYDLVLLDMPPNASQTTLTGLCAADFCIVPTKMLYADLLGVDTLLQIVQNLRIAGLPAPILIGVLPTMFERVTAETQRNYDTLVDAMKSRHLEVLPPIPQDIKVAEAVSPGQTIWEYAPTCRGAIGYETPVANVKVPNSAKHYGGYLHLGEIMAIVLKMRR